MEFAALQRDNSILCADNYFIIIVHVSIKNNFITGVQ